MLYLQFLFKNNIYNYYLFYLRYTDMLRVNNITILNFFTKNIKNILYFYFMNIVQFSYCV